MTTANKITLVRILLVPVFVVCAVYYADSYSDGRTPDDRWRWAAITTFILAATSDGIDGFIARRFNQRTRLGAILDPLADKLLLVAALVTLSATGWPNGFPFWFPILVIARDIITAIGAVMVKHFTGEVRITPHWTGKVATFLVMVAIAWVMLEIPIPKPIVLTVAASVFVTISGAVYFLDGLRRIHASGFGDPDRQL